jgi:hypothetical protein
MAMVCSLSKLAFGADDQPRLSTAVIAGSSPPILRFTLTNTTDSPIECPNFGLTDNKTVVLCPDGRFCIDEVFIDLVDTRTGRMTGMGHEQLAAHESQSWDRPLKELLRPADAPLSAGDYRVYWEYDKAVEGKPLREQIRSNETAFVIPGTPDRTTLNSDLHAYSTSPRIAVWQLSLTLDSGKIPRLCQIDLSQEESSKIESAFVLREYTWDNVKTAFKRVFVVKPDGAPPLEATDDLKNAITNARVTFGPYFETATVFVNPPVLLRRSDREWQLAADSFAKDGKILAQINENIAALERVEKKLRAGEFPSAKDASRELAPLLRNRKLFNLDAEPSPSTAPATRPTK